MLTRNTLYVCVYLLTGSLSLSLREMRATRLMSTLDILRTSSLMLYSSVLVLPLKNLNQIFSKRCSWSAILNNPTIHVMYKSSIIYSSLFSLLILAKGFLVLTCPMISLPLLLKLLVISVSLILFVTRPLEYPSHTESKPHLSLFHLFN